ncbi:MAG: polyprenyl synthetase family protein [Planctomycetes bacterium]|nr:polyprenyl synthetase family protein [Planctomycetota bacterium]
MDLDAYLAQRRARVEEAIRECLEASPPAPLAEPVARAMRFAVEAGGKRLRPTLVLAVADLLKKKEAKVRGLATAVEFLHTSSLVLDDLPSMDDGTVRRGRPTLHRAFDEATAILAAIGLLSLGFREVARAAEEAGLPGEEARDIVAEAADTVGLPGMVGGQHADLRAMKPGADLRTVEFVHSRKTGALFVFSLRSAARLLRARSSETAALEGYAKNLGLAFQVTDDLLDREGNRETLGKDTNADRGKTTFVDLCGVEEARRLAGELLESARAALAPFGERAEVFLAIADFVGRRKS